MSKQGELNESDKKELEEKEFNRFGFRIRNKSNDTN